MLTLSREIFRNRKDNVTEDKTVSVEQSNVESYDFNVIRNIIEEDKNTKKITYRYKEYNEQKEIIKQGKVDCNIASIEEAKQLLETIDYQEFIKLYDHLIVYTNDAAEYICCGEDTPGEKTSAEYFQTIYGKLSEG